VDQRGFRWIGPRASSFLQSSRPVSSLQLHGFSPQANRLRVRVDGVLVGEHQMEAGEEFRLHYLLPFEETGQHLFEVRLECGTFRSTLPEDQRELGLMIFSLELTPC